MNLVENNKITFLENDRSLTLGIELEFQVLDNTSLELTPRANEILESTSIPGLSKEFFQSTIELVTPICENVQEAEHYYKSFLPILCKEGGALDLTFAGTGTHPLADYRDRLITPSPRYLALVDKTQWLIRRMAVYGMHIHFGMKSGEECIAFHNFFLQIIPHMIALSASSPFWQGMHTELAACRPTMYEALPTAGIPYRLESWNGFRSLIEKLMATQSISSLRDLWWDIRPSPALGTLEIRICDGPASLTEMLAIAAFLHTCAHWFEDHKHDLNSLHLSHWAIRENKWRAIRSGLDAMIITSENGNTQSIRNDFENWLSRLEPYYDKLNYSDYLKSLRTILTRGNSSERQKKVFLQTGSLKEVVKLNVEEFLTQKPRTL